MIPTPDLSHLSSKDYLNVYEPAEDTFVLLDALEQDATELQALKPAVCLEIGYAVQTTESTGRQNNVYLNSIQASFAAPLLDRLKKKIDILLFNPPYVPTTFEEMRLAQENKEIEGAWAGGTDGMEMTSIFLDCVEHLLSPHGRFYLVALKANGIDAIRRKMANQYKLKSRVQS